MGSTRKEIPENPRLIGRLLFPKTLNPEAAKSEPDATVADRVSRLAEGAIVYSIRAKRGEPGLWVRIGDIDFGLLGDRGYAWAGGELLRVFDFPASAALSEAMSFLRGIKKEFPNSLLKPRAKLRKAYRAKKSPNWYRVGTELTAKNYEGGKGVKLSECQALLGVSKNTTLRLISEGSIRVVGREGARRMYSVEDALKMVKFIDGLRAKKERGQPTK